MIALVDACAIVIIVLGTALRAKEKIMIPGLILWLLGVPLVVVILLWLFGVL